MTMDSRGLITALLITALAMTSGTNEVEEQSDTCVWVGVDVNIDRGHNSSAQYIGDLMRKLNDIEAEMRVIKQSIANFNNNTLQLGYNMNNRMSTIDNRMSTIDHRMSTIDNRISAIDDKVTTIDNIVSVMNKTKSATNNEMSAIEHKVPAIHNKSTSASVKLQVDMDRQFVCTGSTASNNKDTEFKCMTMHLGVRNGRSVSVFKWTVEDYNNKMVNEGDHYSEHFYHTVPGYKLRLRWHIYSDSDIYIYLQLLPDEYDDQLKWPFNQSFDVTVLMVNGTEARHSYVTSERSDCFLNRPKSESELGCITRDSNWDDVWKNKKHILNDGSVVVKLYLYN